MVFEEAGRKYVLLADTLHSAPAAAEFLVGEGDVVKRNDPLFDSVILYADQNSIPASVMPGMHLGEWLAGGRIRQRDVLSASRCDVLATDEI